ncbi:MAG: hypothetical protein KDB62_10350 [Solirubrobacterales bacterium]|nr:hypothetical protein [Solirubrobacterales bacterium]
MTGMRIVIGLEDFSSFAGTETYARTVAAELQRLGHEVIVHAATTGPIADQVREQGIEVVESETELPATCDAVLSQDAASAFSLAGRYPGARRLMVCHSDYFMSQSPPQLPGVCDAVIVMNDRVGRFVESLGSPGGGVPVIRMTQPVDLKRFGVRGKRTGGPRRALILGNYLTPDRASDLDAVCRQAGLEPVIRGATTTPVANPEQVIADADLVIGLGRCIVEAMAGRRAAFVHGIAGSDGWVTADSYAALESDGFGGTATDLVHDRDRLAADLAGWDPEMGAVNRQIATGRHDSAAHAVELVGHLCGGPTNSAPSPEQADELARLVRAERLSWSRYVEAMNEVRALRDELGQAEELLDSRRYRIGSRLAAPIDAIRNRRR